MNDNDKVYIHEIIDITRHHRAAYMHHMTANWSPLAQETRGQLCYGVWGVVGSTGPWPKVVNIWEEDGFAGLAASFAVELGHPSLQDPGLAKWWAAAAELRSGGFDRIVVPHPATGTINVLTEQGAGGAVYAHEIITVAPGSARQILDDVLAHSESVREQLGWRLVGGWWTAMHDESELIVLWSISDWAHWGNGEQMIAKDLVDTVPGHRREDLRSRERLLLVDAPLSPFKTGRQPARSDQTEWVDGG